MDNERKHGDDVGLAAAGEDSEHSRLRLRNGELWTGLFAMGAVIIALAALTGVDLRFAPLLIVLPTAALGSVRQTVIASVWATAILWAPHLFRPLQLHLELGMTLGMVAFEALAVGACALRVKRERELTRLRSTLLTLQRQMLRPLPVLTAQAMVHGLYEAVDEDRLIGGDVYEVLESPYGTRILIGDVQGKGVAAIGSSFTVLGAFREAAFQEPTLTVVAESLETAIVRHNAFASQSGGPERFVTALLLSIDEQVGVQAISCGHVAPFLVCDGTGGEISLADISVPLGLDELSSQPRRVSWFNLPPHATLLVCTDGVTEARDREGNFYPLAERLPRWSDLTADKLLDALYRDVRGFASGDNHDDIAVLAIRRTTTASIPLPSEDVEPVAG